MTQKIIDLRSRPALLHDFYGATPGTAQYDTARWLNRRTGSKDDTHFTRSHTLDGYLAEIREAGIERAVVVGRETPALTVSNDRIHAIVAPHPELIGIASVDPQARDIDGTLAEIERAVGTLGLRGVNIEPGFGDPPLQPDNPLFFPVYEACVKWGVPVFLMSGPTTPSLYYTDPAPVGRVAAAFPSLPIVCYHGFYPYANEMVGIAFRHENVFVVPDMYTFLPGGSLYIEAANGFMADQLLFGTSYPFRAMRQTIDDFLQLGLRESALERVLHGNAVKLLKLEAVVQKTEILHAA